MNTSAAKAESALLGLAFGDAYGAGTEFMKISDIKEEHGPFGPEFPRPAIVTDDTQMSLYTLNAILNEGNKDENQNLDIEGVRKNFINAYNEWFIDPLNTPDRAPGKTCLESVMKLSSGLNWQEATAPESKGCGTVMRSGVIGLASKRYTAEETARLAALSAVITHGHPAAVYSAVVASLLVREIVTMDLEPKKFATQAVEIAITQMAETTYDEEVLGDLWKRAGYATPEAYHYSGWNDVIYLLRRAKATAAATRKDEEWNTDPCEITGEGWVADEALATAVLIATALGDDPGLALRRSATTNGDSDTIGAIVGVLVGANGFDWSHGWQDSLEPYYREQIEVISAKF